ncbi:branched-chain amino acid aminotransferase [Salmonella enterica subsp. enterica]|uniref:Branched-chain amino acid aminotransferase n=1 Tax=Salmonella enterica I TaxID=59201 RepID=A0A3S4IMW1_SALET|nr:branched-chain amino acid aminotransferase [Salmonella enterica subsp. enterica]
MNICSACATQQKFIVFRFPRVFDELMEACREVIRKNNLTSAYIRPLVFVGDVGMGVNPPPGYTTDVIIAAFPWGAYLGAEALDQGIDAMVSSWNRAAPNTIPTAAKSGRGTIFPHCWWVAKRAATAIRKASPWM